jgi:hypothetical protein
MGGKSGRPSTCSFAAYRGAWHFWKCQAPGRTTAAVAQLSIHPSLCYNSDLASRTGGKNETRETTMGDKRLARTLTPTPT